MVSVVFIKVNGILLLTCVMFNIPLNASLFLLDVRYDKYPSHLFSNECYE